MSNGHNQDARDLFDEALELPAEEQRGFLREVCGDDQALFDEVASLLDFVPDPEGDVLLTPPAASGVAADLRSSLRGDPLAIGDRIGPYVIRGRLGEGGMSVVYRAAQSEPIQREVALKVLKPGMDSAAVLARFERERDVLAALDHPHIAQVFDAGVTPRDRPYVVMELIRGQPLLQSCDQSRLALRERLALFVTICHAVHHAHMRGVIHRDLKPSNLLVVADPTGHAPKVIDFGVAKALQPAEASHTQVGQPVGTPAYMSPEQWAAETDLDVRSDVYSLGVVLYEMLTGQHPYGMDAATSADAQKVRRAQETTDVPRGSTSVTRGKGNTPSVGDMPRASLARALRGDLDWILLKAIARDRSQRYGSALALADDVERHLDRRPVAATPPSLLYLTRQASRRHPGWAVAVVLLIAGLVLGAIANTYHVRRLGRELQEKQQAVIRAEAAEEAAEKRAAELDRVIEFRTEQLAEIRPHVFSRRLREGLLDGVEPADREPLSHMLQTIDLTGLGVSALRATLFTPAHDAVSLRFADEPLIQARLLDAFARSIAGLGDLEDAAAKQAEALRLRHDAQGPDHPDSFASEAALGALLSLLGKGSEGEPMLRRAEKGLRDSVGESDPRTLAAIERLALVLTRQGRLDEAERHWREAYEGYLRTRGEDYPRTLISLGGLASLLARRGKAEEANALHRVVLDRCRKVFGPNHKQTLMALNDAGYSAQSLGRLEEALRLTKEALEGSRRLLGEDHPSTQLSLNNAANLEWSLGRRDLAESMFRKSLATQTRTLGLDHPGTVVTLFNLGNLYQEIGRPLEAEEHLRSALEGSNRRQGQSHPDSLLCLGSLIRMMQAQMRPDEAAALAEELIVLGAEVLPSDDPDLAHARAILNQAAEQKIP